MRTQRRLLKFPLAAFFVSSYNCQYTNVCFHRPANRRGRSLPVTSVLCASYTVFQHSRHHPVSSSHSPPRLAFSRVHSRQSAVKPAGGRDERRARC
ncbi:hypothetical protein F2P81_005849 [Scophthalmus maximus]|uniref:Uncharacterized protein n=1 Tax=Scophthalmus maximus TaxID=52904 RepID=A0A6A4T7P1_SCOMX|nr:hypothetical protein F2P81_005849 [Scophthalmus maximus]